MSFISPFIGSGLGSPAGGGAKPAEGAAGAGGGGLPFIGNAAGGGGDDKTKAAAQTLNTFFGPSDGDQYGNNPFNDFFALGQSIAAATGKKNG